MSDTLKIQLISALNTFVATFVVAVGTSLQGGVEWSGAFWISVLITAGRVGLKALINQFLPVKLGGVRKDYFSPLS